MKNIFISISVAFVFGLVPLQVSGQIFSPNDSIKLFINYFSNFDKEDSGYVYADEPAILRAIPPDSSSGWDFTWQKLDTTSLTFNSYNTDTGSITIDTVSESGLYRVIMQKDTLPAKHFRAWVYIVDSFYVYSENKDEFDTLTSDVSSCNQVLIRLKTNLEERFSYYQIDSIGDSIFFTGNNFPIGLENRVHVDWSAQPAEYDIPETNGLTLADNSPPPENTTYNATATFIGLTAQYKAHLKAIATEAKLNATVVKYDHPLYTDTFETAEILIQNYPYFDSDLFTETSGPAPLWVEFKVDETENATSFYINFGDTLGIVDTSFTDSSQVIYRRYDYAEKSDKDFEITLTSTSSKGCESTATATITVDAPQIGEGSSNSNPDGGNGNQGQESSLNIPNIFLTGGGQNGNFVFRTEDVSYRYLEITIFNRWGRKVHEYTGDIKEWPGWDGRIGNSYANPGVYFYTIKAKNWLYEGTNTSGDIHKEQAGFFHLFRSE